VTRRTADILYGVFRSADLRIALPLSELREVIMRPPAFTPLPASSPGLLGAVNLRHVVIPVLDLCLLCGRPGSAGSGRVIVIVARDGRVFGLLADEIEGSMTVAPEELLEMSVAGNVRSLFSHTFERPEDGTVVALLDADSIAGLPGIPVVRDRGVHVPIAAHRPSAPSPTVLLLQCGDIGLCIDVDHVHSVIPQLRLHKSALAGEMCHGTVELNGYAVPVVDTLRMLSLGVQQSEAAQRGLAVALPRGLVVLAVSEISAIAATTIEDLLLLPSLGLPRTGLITGVRRDGQGGGQLVIDGAALRSNSELDALAALCIPIEEAGRAERAAADGAASPAPVDVPSGRRVVPSVRKFLTYDAGIEVATLLEQVAEIVPYPAHPITVAVGNVLGIFTHRKASVPVMSLPGLLGLGSGVDPMTARVVLIETVDGNLVGFAVPALHAIEESIWEEMGNGDSWDAARLLSRRPLVKLGTPGRARMLPHLDLVAMVRSEQAVVGLPLT
jgi:purine-binding chemotaxis protein CheW